MGTFLGHIVPGSVFIVLALWWTCECLTYYFQNTSKTNFYSRQRFNYGTCHNRLMQGSLMMLGAFILITGEIVSSFSNVSGINNLQHITMNLFFFIFGLVYFATAIGITFPPKFDYICLQMAFAVEALVFYAHLHVHGKSHLESHLHALLIAAIVMCAISISLLLKCGNNILAALATPFWTVVQGTWFWQIGWTLYNPFSTTECCKNDHDQLLFMTAMFFWHVAGDLLFFIILFILYFKTYDYIEYLESRESEKNSCKDQYRPLNGADYSDDSIRC